MGGEIARGDFGATSETVTLQHLIDDYLKYVKANGHKSASIIEGVLGRVSKAREFGNGEKASRKVASLTTKDFDRYRERLVADGVKHATVNNHLAYVRSAIKQEMKRTPSRVAKCPFIPQVKVKNARKGFLEYDDHYSIIDALPESLKALFVVAFHSGCRKGEVINMRWSDVDWTNKVIRLPDTKNGDQRNLPFWGGIEEHLTRYFNYCKANHPDAEYIFVWFAEDTALAHGGVRNVPGEAVADFRGSWKNAVEEAHRLNKSVPADLLFHDLRRSAVRVMVQEAGIPEAQAMLISGHVTRDMLERYNIVSLKNVQDAGAKLDAWQKARKGPKKVVSIRSKRQKAG
jgi:integrase